MVSNRALRVAALASSAFAAVFWMCFARGILGAGGQAALLIGGGLVSAGVAVLAGSLVFGAIGAGSRQAQADAFTVLGIVSLASFVGIPIVEAPVLSGPAFFTPVERFVFLTGLSGSILGSVLYMLLSDRMHPLSGSAVPSSPTDVHSTP
jgi:hypothetical protein